MAPVLSVVMPVYNEAATITQVVESVLSQPLVCELIAIDDASTDATPALLSELLNVNSRLTVRRHNVNRGKGAAVRTGISLATAPIVIIQDADLEYDPEDYGKLIRPIIDGPAEVVFGSRVVDSDVRDWRYFWQFVGNRCLTSLSNIFTNQDLSDMETGFKAFRRELIQKLTMKEDRFGFEPEFTAKLARLGVPVCEVAISYRSRSYAEGKKVTWRDGLSALRCILQYNLLEPEP
jgi:glycosyltransferase involved in cell wall biosynthesis